MVKMGKKAAKSRMIYSWKSDVFYPGGDRGPAGERAKARWIICGYSLIYGLDYDKTASPSADMVTWRMMLSLQVQIRDKERRSAQLDVPTAYLWTTERKHKVFMKQAPGCEEPDSEGMVWELGSYLYGEPPAGLEWFLKLAGKFEERGYKRNPACPAMFVKITKKKKPHDAKWYDDPKNAHRRVTMRAPDGTVGVLGRDFYATFILLQVDDGKIAGNSGEDVKELKKIMAEFDTK